LKAENKGEYAYFWVEEGIVRAGGEVWGICAAAWWKKTRDPSAKRVRMGQKNGKYIEN
jgi:hypothetical protein